MHQVLSLQHDRGHISAKRIHGSKKKGGGVDKRKKTTEPVLKPSNQTEDVWMASTHSEGADYRAAFHGFLRYCSGARTQLCLDGEQRHRG